MKKIVAVVVTYNRKDLLLRCIECLENQRFDTAKASFSVMVVDNNSTDGTAQALAGLVGSGFVDYVNTGSNLGGAGGFNFGMRQAVQAGFDYLWVMDDDCLPKPDALSAFLDADDELEGRWGFLSSVVRWTDGSICEMNIQRHPLFKNIEDFTSRLQPATMASFVSLFVSAAAVSEVGLPIKDFFIWTDDWEFTRRISRAYPSYVVGGSVVVHASATNNPGNIFTDPPERMDRYKYVYRNDWVLYREEGLRGILFLYVRALYHMLRVLLSGGASKREKIAIIAQGMRDGKTFNPPIEYVHANVDCNREGA